MRESCTYGSVRGARDNLRPYRDCSPAVHRPWRMKQVLGWAVRRRGGRRRLGASEPMSEFDRRPFEHR
jgi:hypothetical protein